MKLEGLGILNWCTAGALQQLAELETYDQVQLTPEQIDRIDALLSESWP